MLQPQSLQAALAQPAPPDDDPTTARILDAALSEFLSFGLRRATMEDITRRAQVGRMTLHRRFPSKQALIEAVVLREIRRVLDEVGAIAAEHDDLADKLVHSLSNGIRRVATHPLFGRLLETDREAMLPYLTTEAGALMLASTSFVAEQIGKGRRGQYAAEAIIRFSHSVLLTPTGQFDLSDEAQLRRFMRAAIPPLLPD